MPRANSSFDIRAEHPQRVHVDRQMKEIRMKKAARDQLPHLESDGAIELGDNKMANWPEREPGQQPWPDTASKVKTATFTPISNLVSRAMKQPNRICLCAYEDHKG